MKKLICIAALCLASPLTFADEASVQMVLDSVHSKGFISCDDKIRDQFKDSTIKHVETKVPSTSVALDDEIIIVIDYPGNAEYDWTGGILSFIFRKVGKQCLMAEGIRVGASINRNCQQVANNNDSHYKVVTKTNDAIWTRHSDEEPWDTSFRKDGSTYIYTPLNGGGCRNIALPEDITSRLQKKK